MYCTHYIKSLVYKQYQYTNSVSNMQCFFKDGKQDDEKDGKEESAAATEAAPVVGEGKREEGMCARMHQF